MCECVSVCARGVHSFIHVACWSQWLSSPLEGAFMRVTMAFEFVSACGVWDVCLCACA